MRTSRTMVVLLLATVYLPLLSSALMADPFDNANEAFRRSDYAAALRVLQPLAHQDARAQVLIGNMYVEGNGLPRDYTEAMNWYRRAAERGSAAGEYGLGVLHHNGWGTRRDAGEAALWYRRAAAQGYAQAQAALGRLYASGEGVPQDLAEAVRWLQKAADQGYAFAQRHLGRMYTENLGVPRDHVEAAKWYLRAAEQGDADAALQLGWVYHNGYGVAQDDDQASAWYRKAAERGNAAAAYAVGTRYYNGVGVTQDHGEAAAWFRRAAERGNVDAQAALGQLYASGVGVLRDRTEAARWLRSAAEAGSETARTELARVEAEQTAEARRAQQQVEETERAQVPGTAPKSQACGYERNAPASSAEYWRRRCEEEAAASERSRQQARSVTEQFRARRENARDQRDRLVLEQLQDCAGKPIVSPGDSPTVREAKERCIAEVTARDAARLKSWQEEQARKRAEAQVAGGPPASAAVAQGTPSGPQPWYIFMDQPNECVPLRIPGSRTPTPEEFARYVSQPLPTDAALGHRSEYAVVDRSPEHAVVADLNDRNHFSVLGRGKALCERAMQAVRQVLPPPPPPGTWFLFSRRANECTPLATFVPGAQMPEDYLRFLIERSGGDPYSIVDRGEDTAVVADVPEDTLPAAFISQAGQNQLFIMGRGREPCMHVARRVNALMSNPGFTTFVAPWYAVLKEAGGCVAITSFGTDMVTPEDVARAMDRPPPGNRTKAHGWPAPSRRGGAVRAVRRGSGQRQPRQLHLAGAEQGVVHGFGADSAVPAGRRSRESTTWRGAARRGACAYVVHAHAPAQRVRAAEPVPNRGISPWSEPPLPWRGGAGGPRRNKIRGERRTPLHDHASLRRSCDRGRCL